MTEDEGTVPIVSMREYLERVLDERDKLYTAKFVAAEVAVAAALASAEKAVSAAFESSEKAIIKAEEAQKAYNLSHNDLIRKTEAQNQATVPRSETMALLKALEEKLEAQRITYDKTIDANMRTIADLRLAMSHLLSIDTYETGHRELQRQVNDLRESRSETTGKSTGANALWGYLVAIAGIGLALVFHFIK